MWSDVLNAVEVFEATVLDEAEGALSREESDAAVAKLHRFRALLGDLIEKAEAARTPTGDEVTKQRFREMVEAGDATKIVHRNKQGQIDRITWTSLSLGRRARKRFSPKMRAGRLEDVASPMEVVDL